MSRESGAIHGQSTANADEASLDHATILLSPRVVEQAQSVARSFTFAPDLIIISPFSRAQELRRRQQLSFLTLRVRLGGLRQPYLEGQAQNGSIRLIDQDYDAGVTLQVGNEFEGKTYELPHEVDR